jgi:hypothetical protein
MDPAKGIPCHKVPNTTRRFISSTTHLPARDVDAVVTARKPAPKPSQRRQAEGTVVKEMGSPETEGGQEEGESGEEEENNKKEAYVVIHCGGGRTPVRQVLRERYWRRTTR